MGQFDLTKKEWDFKNMKGNWKHSFFSSDTNYNQHKKSYECHISTIPVFSPVNTQNIYNQ